MKIIISSGLCEQLPEKHPWDKIARYHQKYRLVEEDEMKTKDLRNEKHDKLLEYNQQGQQRYGTEKKSQHRVLTSDLKKVCKTCEEAKTIAQDKGRLKANGVVICPPWDAVN